MAPLYEYACPSCSHRFEERVSTHESPAPDCPQCGAKEAKRQISRFAVSGQGDLRESTMHGCHGPFYNDGKSGNEGHGSGCGHCH
jgi:putative FmdB family regulatory protein